MTPVSLGPQPIDRVFVAPEGAVADRLDQALDAVERVYREPSERVVDLEAVWQIIDRDPHRNPSALAHVVCTMVGCRQNQSAAQVRTIQRFINR